MNQPSLTALKAAIYEMGLYFNQQPSDDRITAYAKALANYSDKQVIFAFKHLKPQEETHDKAPQIAAEMLKLIRWYGKHDEENMLKNASPEARETFLRLGDTQDIRNSENTDTVRAQLERLARSVMQSKQVEVKNKQLENIGIVLPLKRPDFSGYLPGGDIA
jgi:Golgi nucleoside diphosphatase